MYKTMLQITAVVCLGYVAFQVGRSWDEISADAAEIVDDVVNGPGGDAPGDTNLPPNPTVMG